MYVTRQPLQHHHKKHRKNSSFIRTQFYAIIGSNPMKICIIFCVSLATILLISNIRISVSESHIPTTLDGPFDPVTRRFDPSLRRGSDDLPMTHPRLRRNVTANFPEQIALAISSPTSMWVSWVTGDAQVGLNVTPLDPASVGSEVWYGKESGNYTKVGKGDSLIYSQLYPFEGLWNYTSGIIHHVKLNGLEPGTRYYYKCGDSSIPAMSQEHFFETFQTPSPTTYPGRIAVVGDVGLTSNSTTTIDHLIHNDPSMILMIGDLTYANQYRTTGGTAATCFVCEFPNAPIRESYQPRWDGWGRFMEPLTSKIPMMVIEGNHEIEPQVDGITFKSYLTRFSVPAEESGSKTNFYYSFDVGGIHFIMLGSYVDYNSTGAQFAWLKKDLQNVDRSVTPWLVATWHSPWYNSYASHYQEFECMRLEMEELIYQYRVDIVFNGHVHAYERMNRVYNYTLNPCGPVYITVGDGGNIEKVDVDHADDPGKCPSPGDNIPEFGGVCHLNFSSGPAKGNFCWNKQPEWSAFRESSFGHGIFEVVNSTHALWTWHRNQDSYKENTVGDQIYIVRQPELCLKDSKSLDSQQSLSHNSSSISAASRCLSQDFSIIISQFLGVLFIYALYSQIGQGTYSSVFRAREVETGRMFALKKVRFDNFQPESIRFMAREITILRRLDHPNIMKLEGIITSRQSNSIYLVFEYMEHDLAGLVSRPDITFTDAQIKCYMRQLLSGIEHCHVRGIMHRDIKVSNILLNNEGVLKIGDFGLANTISPSNKNHLTSRVVTLWYRPPELLMGSTNYGVSVDLWSVGCVFAELFLGKPILKGRTEVEQLHKIFKLCGAPPEEFWKKCKLPHATMFRPQTNYPSSLRDRCADFPETAVDLLETLLSIDPINRGTASSALISEYFNTKPFACNPSSLPKYTPSKEMDAKGRDDSSSRKNTGDKSREVATSRRQTRRVYKGQDQKNFGKTTAKEDMQNLNGRRDDGKAHPSKGKVGMHKEHSRHPMDSRSETSQLVNMADGSGYTVPVQVPGSNDYTWVKRRKQDASSTVSDGSKSKISALDPHFAKGTYELSTQRVSMDFDPKELLITQGQRDEQGAYMNGMRPVRKSRFGRDN